MALCKELKPESKQEESCHVTTISYLQQPYSSKESILVLGEQDFSLSLAIRQKYKPKQLVATAYYKEPPNQKYWRNIDQLSMLGSIVKFNVDALNLESSLKQVGVKQKYDRIMFTFPRSEKIQNDKHNRQFIVELCENAVNCLNEPNGELHLLLHFNEQHLESQYHHWKINEIPNWIQINQLQFNLDTITKELFPGYGPKTEKGKNWKPKLPVMCLMTPNFELIHKKKVQQQIESDYQMALNMSGFDQTADSSIFNANAT